MYHSRVFFDLGGFVLGLCWTESETESCIGGRNCREISICIGWRTLLTAMMRRARGLPPPRISHGRNDADCYVDMKRAAVCVSHKKMCHWQSNTTTGRANPNSSFFRTGFLMPTCCVAVGFIFIFILTFFRANCFASSGAPIEKPKPSPDFLRECPYPARRAWEERGYLTQQGTREPKPSRAS
jgi:hypothetical protein